MKKQTGFNRWRRKEKYATGNTKEHMQRPQKHTPERERVVSNGAGERGWEQFVQAKRSILRAVGSYGRA